jgi:branched-subunit amino acid ABC-type transport system permease component
MSNRFKSRYDDDINLFEGRWHLAQYALLVALLLAAPWLLGTYYLGELTAVLIWSLAGLGLMLISGHTGQVSLGHAAFMAIGAFTNLALMMRGWHFIPALLASAVTSGVLGAIISRPILRMSGIYLAIAKEYEPTLLLPIGFGVLLGNLPNSPLNHPGGMLYILNEFGIQTELLPLFIFIGIGAMMDFRPLLSQPIFAVLGAAGQLGIFATLILATQVGFPLNEAASIAVIGAIDGPTSIYVSSLLAPRLLPAIAVTAYSYMSLVPIIQPPLMRLFTTRAERRIRMEYAPRPVPRAAVIAFPIIVTIAVGVLVPASAPLVATLMFSPCAAPPTQLPSACCTPTRCPLACSYQSISLKSLTPPISATFSRL